MWPKCPQSVIVQVLFDQWRETIRKWSKSTQVINCGFNQNALSHVTQKYQIGKV